MGELCAYEGRRSRFLLGVIGVGRGSRTEIGPDVRVRAESRRYRRPSLKSLLLQIAPFRTTMSRDSVSRIGDPSGRHASVVDVRRAATVPAAAPAAAPMTVAFVLLPRMRPSTAPATAPPMTFCLSFPLAV